MASTKFEVSMEIFKFQGEPDVSVTLTGKSPAELNTALKTLETIAKTATLYDGDSAPEAEKSVTSEPKQAAPVVSTADKKAPPREAGKLAPATAPAQGPHAPALPEVQERVCTVLARTANDRRGPEIERLYLDSKILPGELQALVMVSNCLEREFVHRQLATGQPLHMNIL